MNLKAIWGAHEGPVFSLCVLRDGTILSGQLRSVKTILMLTLLLFITWVLCKIKWKIHFYTNKYIHFVHVFTYLFWKLRRCTISTLYVHCTGGGRDGRIVKYDSELRSPLGEEATVSENLGAVRVISQGKFKSKDWNGKIIFLKEY